ncbi:hypothetical protein C474_08152 [Halogeometricum pallidum JCM 14848]|uniref:Right handed beta helix domain-containing protein n=1 Tax=Halogeometricum pallidum JCM 14848 TaxID=1227487 RepID=M0D810_HALPD|nr:hypothetical protein [Halogeometricum pallidum]ELZ31630.1 hypothetical protein C474_08152 [Halogeometricum pallidum JCM 14848]
MKRRAFLASAASAGLLPLAGCSVFDDSKPSTPTGTLPRTGVETPRGTAKQYQSYDRVVRLADRGVGEASKGRVGSIIASELADDTLFVVPAGRHFIDPVRVNGYRNVGVVGAPNGRTTLVPTSAASETGWLFTFENGGDFEFGRFDLDFRGEDVGASLTLIATVGNLYLHNVHAFGVYPYDTYGVGVSLTDPDGEGVIEQFIARDGSTYDSPGAGIFVAQGHAGKLEIRDCEVWNWADNGVYASSPGYVGGFKGQTTADRGNGVVHVRGGVYKNNNIANIRIGSTYSSVRGALIRNERNPTGDTWDARRYPIMPRSGSEPDPVVNSRGIRLTNRHHQLVADCDIVMNAGRSDGAIVANGATGTNTIRNTRIHVDTDEVLYPINLKGPSIDWRRYGFTVTGVTITGTSTARDAAVRVQGRDDTSFENCCISLDGGNQNGIAFENCRNCAVSNSTIDVPGQMITTRDATVKRMKLRANGTCAASNS